MANLSNQSRRKFLRQLGRLGVTVAAVDFGLAIDVTLAAPKRNIAIVYATKYGSTQDTAKWIAQGMQRNVTLINSKHVISSEKLNRYDGIVLGSAIIQENVLPEMRNVTQAFSMVLKEKLLATFIVCGTQANTEQGKQRIAGYFERFHTNLPVLPQHHQQFGGRMVVDNLTTEDREAMTRFYEKVLKRKLSDWDRTNPQLASQYGGMLRRKLANIGGG